MPAVQGKQPPSKAKRLKTINSPRDCAATERKVHDEIRSRNLREPNDYRELFLRLWAFHSGANTVKGQAWTLMNEADAEIQAVVVTHWWSPYEKAKQ